jgi:hypothetical protein
MKWLFDYVSGERVLKPWRSGFVGKDFSNSPATRS